MALRKSCRECTRTKRKCTIQVPKCTRCVKRGLECIYDVEHINAPYDLNKELGESQLNSHQDGHCLLRAVAASDGVADPSTGNLHDGHDHTWDLIRRGYQVVPDHIKARQPSVFVHPSLRLPKGSFDHLSIFEAGAAGNVDYADFRRLIRLDVESRGVCEILTAVQALLVYMGTFMLAPSDYKRRSIEDAFPVLWKWTQILLDCARRWHPREISLWQQWILGESVRRTILMSYTLSMIHSVLHNGECSNWLFLESLPFDRRPGLWIAQSPQAWIASAGVRTGAEVGEVLSSFHEFAEDHKGPRAEFCGDMFMSLLVISHNGGGSVRLGDAGQRRP